MARGQRPAAGRPPGIITVPSQVGIKKLKSQGPGPGPAYPARPAAARRPAGGPEAPSCMAGPGVTNFVTRLRAERDQSRAVFGGQPGPRFLNRTFPK